MKKNSLADPRETKLMVDFFVKVQKFIELYKTFSKVSQNNLSHPIHLQHLKLFGFLNRLQKLRRA